jgi:hypothetical protein
MEVFLPRWVVVAPSLGAEKVKQVKITTHYQSSDGQQQGVIWWIEKLIDTPFDDCRKRSRDLIIVPYLVVRKGMTDINEIEAIVMKWADKCAELYPLEPSRREYAKIRSRAKQVNTKNLVYRRQISNNCKI